MISQAELDAAGLEAVRAVPGVAAIQMTDIVGVEVVGPEGRSWVGVQAKAEDPRLDGVTTTDGTLPGSAGEIALPADLARTVGVETGDTVTVVVTEWRDEESIARSSTATVTGLLSTSGGFLAQGGVGVVSAATWRDWYATMANGVPFWEATVALAPGTSSRKAIEAIEPLVGDYAEVLTRDERAARAAAELSGSTWVLTAVVLGFAAVSLLVASLVIANTFQVLVAQRTRTLALLRCVGAERRQLRRSVLLEACLLGLAASLGGVLSGIALVQVALTVLGRATDVPLPATVTITWQVLVVPLVVGTAVTVLASLAPARAATRVSPLEALRPADPVHGGAGAARAWVSGLLVAGGGAGLALGWVTASAVSMPIGLAVGMLGGGGSFVGGMGGAGFWGPG
ncbi:MAG TPA: ABC transporter permease, partial [Actinotalea sp.]|nr:ABC transporter permease [Actinotalea sp.]